MLLIVQMDVVMVNVIKMKKIKSKQKNERGLSPVIATVLLITLTIILASIVFLWARSFLGEQVQKAGRNPDEACKEIAFDVDYTKSGNILELQFANRGSLPIIDFKIKLISGGNTELKQFNSSVDSGMTSERKPIPISDGVTKIEIYPLIQGKGVNKGDLQMIDCENNNKVINL